MRSLNFLETRISEARLREIKDNLEVNHKRKVTDEEVMAVAKFLYNFAQIAVDAAVSEKEWEAKLMEFSAGYAFELRGYSCRVCGGSGEADMWYDRFGLKCLYCQRAVDLGIIPGELTGNPEWYYTEHEMAYFFNVKEKLLKQWIKKGIIISREIPDFKRPGTTYVRLFLMADNVGFLPHKEMLIFSDTVPLDEDEGWTTPHLKWYECCDPFEYLKQYGIMQYLKPIYREGPNGQ